MSYIAHTHSTEQCGLRDELETNAATEAAVGDRQFAATEESKQLLAAIEENIRAAEQTRQQSLGEFQRLAVELAVAIAGEIVFRAIDQHQFGVEGLVAAAVERLGLDAPLTITLHPSDVSLLEAQQSANEASCPAGAITVRSDSTLPRGHCRASSGTTMLLSELAPRLEEIRESLLEGLDDAQIERRRTAGLGQALKRFPDRRETA